MMTFRGEGRFGEPTKPFFAAGRRVFLVLRHQPGTNARNVRPWFPHPPTLLIALLAYGGWSVATRSAEAAETPVYETVVVAEPETAREDCAASSSVITADRTPRAAETVTQLLSEQAGAVVSRYGGMGSTATISLRASTANQVSVYVDGVPLHTATGGGVDLGAIPIGDVERIEIYRGMSPIAFGASAIGGVVSITTAAPTTNRLQLDAGGGSFGTYYGGIRAAWNRGRLHVYGGAHALSSEGDFPYVNTQYTMSTADDQALLRRNNDVRQLDGTIRAIFDLSTTRHFSASFLFFDRDQGLPGPLGLANPVARLRTMRTTAILGYEGHEDLGPGGHFRAIAYGTFDRTRYRDPGQLSAEKTDTDDRLETAGATLTWRRVARPWLILSGIVDSRYDRFAPSDQQATGSPGKRLFAAAGLESDLWFQSTSLDIIPSFRLEMAREETSGRTEFYRLAATAPPVDHVLPIVRLSVMKGITSWLSLRANGGRYARLPSLVELYGNTGYLLGRTSLKPERGLNADVGPALSWKGSSSRIVWTASVFASVIDDMIQYEYLGGHARPDNIGSATILGVESDATLELGRHARVILAATISDARNTSAIPSEHDRQLPLRPRYRAYARPEWRAIELTGRIAIGVYADCDATGPDYLVPDNSVRASSRFILGAGLYASLPAGFSARLSAQNLANSAINDIVNYPLPGRELYLTVAWSTFNNQPTKELQ